MKRRATPRQSRRQTAVRVKGRTRTPGRRRHLQMGSVDVQDAESLRAEIDRLAKGIEPARWNADADDVQRSVVKLVLTLVEFLRQLLERQAIRRMENGTISAAETEAIGLALMRLEETVRDLGARFDLTIEDLNLDLGPAGRLI